MADSVEKVFFGRRTKILKTADASRARRREGPHRFTHKRPGTSVSALWRLVAIETSNNRLSRDFWRRSIFDFSTVSAKSGSQRWAPVLPAHQRNNLRAAGSRAQQSVKRVALRAQGPNSGRPGRDRRRRSHGRLRGDGNRDRYTRSCRRRWSPPSPYTGGSAGRRKADGFR